MGDASTDSAVRFRTSSRRRAALGLDVLVVEDDEQVATVLATLLENEGYEVRVAGTADAGLQALRARQPHLLVSDYWLPDRTGAWMLNEASNAGLLRETQILVVTAEQRPQGVENLRILRKPLDLDDFLRAVHDELLPVRQRETERAAKEMHGVHASRDGRAKVDLTLYISSSSPSSLRALRNLHKLLEDYPAADVSLSVKDLARESPPEAEADRIVFTPTLVKRFPQPKVWVLGDLADPSIVADLLLNSGVEKAQ